ncbi:uncharacterized protein LOC126088489 [Schistocerca cancellata]|uniref:uncharacterized protein LOC126088489 n=1 Tax=Schistocerca cancellata TaxID=274614 RepID=UPI00211787EC|nr:uncharacterized protein LOC126088489 [Schistocerca cancellata]
MTTGLVSVISEKCDTFVNVSPTSAPPFFPCPLLASFRMRYPRAATECDSGLEEKERSRPRRQFQLERPSSRRPITRPAYKLRIRKPAVSPHAGAALWGECGYWAGVPPPPPPPPPRLRVSPRVASGRSAPAVPADSRTCSAAGIAPTERFPEATPPPPLKEIAAARPDAARRCRVHQVVHALTVEEVEAVASPHTVSMDSGISSAGNGLSKTASSSAPATATSSCPSAEEQHRALDALLTDMLLTVQSIPDLPPPPRYVELPAPA